MNSKNSRPLNVTFATSLAVTVICSAVGSARGQFDFSGACCTSSGSCSVILIFDCNNAGGSFLGTDTTCEPGTCAGACCLPDGGCQDLDGPECDLLPGDYRGFGTSCSSESCGTPLGTEFTYQGKLKASGMPAVSNADFEFALFDEEEDGAQVGPTLSADDVGLVSGLFTIRLDFGADAFNGQARWIEVAVRSPAGAGGFTTLAPRQPLSAVPYAMQTRGIYVDNGGRVGIGTSSPETNLHVSGAARGGIRIDGSAEGEANLSFVEFDDVVGTTIGFVGDQSNGNADMYLRADIGDIHLFTSAGPALTAKADGNVGIGTTTPQSNLDVRGDIKLGPSGELFVSSGEENLRIVRGKIVQNGPDVGSGFSATHGVLPGTYTITFDRPFAELPIVTATAAHEGISGIVQIESVGTDSADLIVFQRDTGERVDRDVYFIAIGPR